MGKKCHFTRDHCHCGQSFGVVAVLGLQRRNGVDDVLTCALINKGKTELLVFACMALKYAAKNTCIMESEINP